MEQQGNTLDFTKNLLNYMDVDTTTSQFLQYFVNDFMSYFPQDILADKSKTIKLAKQLYQSKGTPASYQFLFRVLYNSDVDIFYNKDAILRASAGKWYVPRSLKLATSDPNFLNIKNLRLFGNISKSIATVEAAIFDGLKTEVFISNIERLFQSGETVTVVDSNNQLVYFLNGSIVPVGTIGAETLTALIVGQISQVLIDPLNRGTNYVANTISGIYDPVVVYGGLNPNTASPIGATVQVGSVTSGGIKNIDVVTKGYGYTTAPSVNNSIGSANTYISSGGGSIITVGTLDNSANSISIVTNIPVDSIQKRISITIGNTSYGFANNLSANANTTLANAFTFTNFTAYPISSVIIQNGGGGLTSLPVVQASSQYTTENYEQTNLANLGILAPIQIINSGSGYANNDKIAIIGGSGYGAFANVTSVNSSGSILTVSYVSNSTNRMTLGGMGYQYALPTVVVANVATGTIVTSNTSNVVTGNGTTFLTQVSNGSTLVTNTNIIIGTVSSVTNANSLILTTSASTTLISNSFYKSTASLVVPGTLGTGAILSASGDTVGAITSFNVLDNGQDYISAPTVSLKVQDLIVSNVIVYSLPNRGDTIYQGSSINTASYIAYVDSIISLQPNIQSNNSIYQLRVYNYTSKPSASLPLKIDSSGSALSLVGGYTTNKNTTFINYGPDTRFDAANGIMTYGDGYAKASATFLNGLVIGNGQYLDTSGQPSSFDILQDTQYNNYTYQLTLSKEIEKYRSVLLNLLHPAGLQAIGRIAMSSNNKMNFIAKDAVANAHTLGYYDGAAATATIVGGSATNPSNNIVTFSSLYGANIATVFFANSSTLSFTYGTRPTDIVTSLVVAVNGAANTVTLQDNVWTYFANVAVVSAKNGNNQVINIDSLTYSYNIVNGGVYSNTAYPIIDTIRIGDRVSVNGSAQTVTTISSPYTSLTLSGPLANGANGLMSVSRSMISSNASSIQIFGPAGVQYFAELGTENGYTIITETGATLLIG
jgi:hypothetical protein